MRSKLRAVSAITQTDGLAATPSRTQMSPDDSACRLALVRTRAPPWIDRSICQRRPEASAISPQDASSRDGSACSRARVSAIVVTWVAVCSVLARLRRRPGPILRRWSPVWNASAAPRPSCPRLETPGATRTSIAREAAAIRSGSRPCARQETKKTLMSSLAYAHKKAALRRLDSSVWRKGCLAEIRSKSLFFVADCLSPTPCYTVCYTVAPRCLNFPTPMA